MGKFTKDCEDLLKYVGGKENINAVTHCVTRMRFVLADPSKADVDAIEKSQCERDLHAIWTVPGDYRERSVRILQ